MENERGGFVVRLWIRSDRPEKSIKDVMQTFEHCKTQCREISGEKYYYCVMAHTVAKNRNYNIGKVDYIDLSDVKDRKILLEFELGYNDKGFWICAGFAGEKKQSVF